MFDILIFIPPLEGSFPAYSLASLISLSLVSIRQGSILALKVTSNFYVSTSALALRKRKRVLKFDVLQKKNKEWKVSITLFHAFKMHLLLSLVSQEKLGGDGD